MGDEWVRSMGDLLTLESVLSPQFAADMTTS